MRGSCGYRRAGRFCVNLRYRDGHGAVRAIRATGELQDHRERNSVCERYQVQASLHGAADGHFDFGDNRDSYRRSASGEEFPAQERQP
jgi:hypothetical protein